MQNFTNSQMLLGVTTPSNEEFNQNRTTIDEAFNQLMMNNVSAPLIGALLLIMFSMGCTVDLNKLWALLKRPWGLAVGIVCQFGFMPLIAFTMAVSFKLKPAPAIAVLVLGSCPGGTISNVMSYWTDGDMDLSVVMTLCSTILAIGFMPLSLSIYSTTLTQEFNNSSNSTQASNIEVPYKQIGMTLIALIIPLSFGIFVKRKWPDGSKIILKVGTGVGATVLIVLAVVISLLYRGSWNADLPLLIIGIINPLIGYVVGFILAVILQQSWKRCRTIALETGAQSGHLCITILMISFKQEELRSMFAYPLIYICFQIFHGLMFVTAYQLYRRFKKPSAASMDSSQSVI
ncbi:sodium-dependent organic anion transporter-like [Heptranchias perlo]|uniref:sodium-dependent organic anion transporter-like n=1 Tax=Heptranchias perlo TaxID=212740 RepID=UPI003559776B